MVVVERVTLNAPSKSALANFGIAPGSNNAAATVKASDFAALKEQVSSQQQILNSFSQGQGVLQSISGFTTPNGILNAGLGAAKAFPILAIAISVGQILADKFTSQFGAGGTRDTRVKVTDETFSNIGVENETDISSGRKLFLSNPTSNQGVPRGPSNTEFLRDGIRLYNLRQEGTYT